jgi:hypothetical protein
VINKDGLAVVVVLWFVVTPHTLCYSHRPTATHVARNIPVIDGLLNDFSPHPVMGTTGPTPVRQM